MLSKMASSKFYSEVSMVNLKLIIEFAAYMCTGGVLTPPVFIFFYVCACVCVLPGLGYKVE